MKVVLVVVIAFVLSSCVAGPIVFTVDEFEGPKMFSKTIHINANYQKLAYCYNSKFSDSAWTSIETLNEIGIVKWSHDISQHHIGAIIEFKKISTNKTEAQLSSVFEEERSFGARLGLPQMESDLKNCAL